MKNQVGLKILSPGITVRISEKEFGLYLFFVSSLTENEERER
jgi:hypothetical protein